MCPGKNCAGYLEGKQKGTGSYFQGTCRVLEENMGIPTLKGKKLRPGRTGQGKSDHQEVLAPGCVKAATVRRLTVWTTVAGEGTARAASKP